MSPLRSSTRRERGLAAFGLSLALATGGPAVAHDVGYDLRGTGDVRLVFQYGDGSPMAGAAFHVFAPGGAAEVFSGVTDPGGEAAFHAGQDGAWRVEADDGKGHTSRARIEILRGLPAAAQTVPAWFATGSLALNILLASELVRRWRASRWRPRPYTEPVTT